VPVPAGDFMVREVGEAMSSPVAAVVPNLTDVAPVNPVPVTVTVVPPATGPAAGEILVTAGTVSYVDSSAGDVALVPPGVVTVTSTVPAPAGETAVIWVVEVTVKLDAAVVPNITAVAPLNPVPVTVTEVPPATGPAAGVIPVTAGMGSYVNSSAGEV